MRHRDLSWVENPGARRLPFELCERAARAFRAVDQVHAFHETLPGYRPTQLVRLDSLAHAIDVAAVHIKDEGARLELGAFKVLGGAYALASELARRLNLPAIPAWPTLAEQVRSRLGGLTVITATDGNHGHGLAWAARQLGLEAVVLLPAGCARSRFERISAEGAHVTRTELSYDAAVEFAAAESRVHGWILVQDTSWDGYEVIPEWIMQGYLTVIHEAVAQWQAAGADELTHVFVQAGVGSFAASVMSYLAARWADARPRLVVIEPAASACLFASMRAPDGMARAIHAGTRTMMAGLDCGRPNPQAWEILRKHADGFISCDDEYSALGMRILGNPSGLDQRIVAGESGAVGVGVLSALRLDSRHVGMARAIGLTEESGVLLFNTEADTDPDNYRKVTWDGAHPYGLNSASAESRKPRRGSRKNLRA